MENKLYLGYTIGQIKYLKIKMHLLMVFFVVSSLVALSWKAQIDIGSYMFGSETKDKFAFLLFSAFFMIIDTYLIIGFLKKDTNLNKEIAAIRYEAKVNNKWNII